MGSEQWKVELYEKENGRCPTLDFLSSLSAHDKVFVDKAIERLTIYGPQIGEPYVEHLRSNIWELRIKVQRINYRILFFIIPENRKIILLNGFKKKTRNVDPKEINKAIEYRNKYLGR